MYSKFGIDKAKINHIEVLEVDFKRLKKPEYGNVTVAWDNGRFQLPLIKHNDGTFSGGEVFKSILISKDRVPCPQTGMKFGRFHAGTHYLKENGEPTNYATMTILTSEIRRSNVVPLDVRNFKNHVKWLFEHLHKDYGIKCDYSNARIDGIELTANIKLKEDFSKYHRCFTFLKDCADPRCYKKDLVMGIVGNPSKETFLVKNKSSTLETLFYDKGVQTDMGKRLARFEVRLKRDDTVNKYLGTNLINELTQGGVIACVRERFDNGFYMPLIKYADKEMKKINKLITKWNKNGDNWRNNLVEYLLKMESMNAPALIDVNDLCDAVKSVSTHRNFARDWKRLKNESCFKAYTDQWEKIEEIRDKIVNDKYLLEAYSYSAPDGIAYSSAG